MILSLLLATTLRYDAPPTCPPRDEFIAAVDAQVGKAAFTGGPQQLSITILRRGPRHFAVLTVEAPNEPPRRREIDSSSCNELIQALATMAAVVIDPQDATPAPEPAPEPPPAPPVEAVLVQPPPVPQKLMVFRLGAGVTGALALGPAPTLGFALEVGFGLKYFSLNAEANVNLPAQTPGSAPGVSSMVSYAAISPCGHVSWFVGCVRIGAGALRGEGVGVDDPKLQTTFYALIAARAGVEIPVYKILYIRTVLDLIVPLTRTTLTLNDEPRWTTPAIAGALSLQLLLRID